MARDFSRANRVAEQVRRELAGLIRSESDDPRMTMVSITEVEISRDLSVAKVFVTYLGDADERNAVVGALNRIAPGLRGAIGRRMHIRSAPSLTFVYDDLPEQGARLTRLIEQAVASDAAKPKAEPSRNPDEPDPNGAGAR